jgi:hypothetical protein
MPVQHIQAATSLDDKTRGRPQPEECAGIPEPQGWQRFEPLERSTPCQLGYWSASDVCFLSH